MIFLEEKTPGMKIMSNNRTVKSEVFYTVLTELSLAAILTFLCFILNLWFTKEKLFKSIYIFKNAFPLYAYFLRVKPGFYSLFQIFLSRFLNDNSISLWRFLNVPLKRNSNQKMLGSGHWTCGNLVTQSLLQAYTAGQWAGTDCLLEELPHPLLRMEVDTVRTQLILQLTEGKISGHGVIFFLPTHGHTLHNTLLPRQCEAAESPAPVSHKWIQPGSHARSLPWISLSRVLWQGILVFDTFTK